MCRRPYLLCAHALLDPPGGKGGDSDVDGNFDDFGDGQCVHMYSMVGKGGNCKTKMESISQQR